MSAKHPMEELRRLQRVKSLPTQSRQVPLSPNLGPELVEFFKTQVARRQGRLDKLAQAWNGLVPSTLNAHCALEGFSKGTLNVIVDSASHLYELRQLLLAGLQKQLFLACKGAGLRKISLKPGRWYEGDDPRDRRVRFGAFE